MFRAPEQVDLCSGFAISEKVDIFSLGCLVYYLLFFRKPFEAHMVYEHSNARYSIPQTASLSPGMLALLQKSLERDPSKRSSSIDLLSQLEFLKDMKLLRNRQVAQRSNSFEKAHLAPNAFNDMLRLENQRSRMAPQFS